MEICHTQLEEFMLYFHAPVRELECFSVKQRLKTELGSPEYSIALYTSTTTPNKTKLENKENNKKKKKNHSTFIFHHLTKLKSSSQNMLAAPTQQRNWRERQDQNYFHPTSHLQLQQPQLPRSVCPDCHGKPILPRHSLAEAPTAAAGSVIIWADTTQHGSLEPGKVCSSLQWEQEMVEVTKMNNKRKM